MKYKQTEYNPKAEKLWQRVEWNDSGTDSWWAVKTQKREESEPGSHPPGSVFVDSLVFLGTP